MYSVDCLSSWSCSFTRSNFCYLWKDKGRILFVELCKRQSFLVVVIRCTARAILIWNVFLSVLPLAASCQVLMDVVVFVLAFDVWNSFSFKLYSIKLNRLLVPAIQRPVTRVLTLARTVVKFNNGREQNYNISVKASIRKNSITFQRRKRKPIVCFVQTHRELG